MSHVRLSALALVLAVAGGISPASVDYTLDDGNSEDMMLWVGRGGFLSMNVFNVAPAANVIDQVSVAWGTLPFEDASGNPLSVQPAKVWIFAVYGDSTRITTDNLRLLTELDVNVTPSQINHLANDWTVANPLWTTYNVSPTAVGTTRFAVATMAVQDIINGDPVTPAGYYGTNLMDRNRSDYTTPVSYLGMTGNSSAFIDPYGRITNLQYFNTPTDFGWAGYMTNDPFLIRASDKAGAQMPGTAYLWNSNSNSGTFNWDNSGGQNNWNTGVGGAFPDGIGDSATILSAWTTIDLGGATRTVGTMILGSWMWNPCIADLRNGTLIFQVSSGSAVLNDQKDPWATGPDDISANVHLGSPLIINTPEEGQWGIGWNTNNGLRIDGVISGNNSLTKTGSALLYLTNTSNSFTGDIHVQDGILRFESSAVLGDPTNALHLGGVGTVGRLLIGDGTTFTRPFVLTGEGGEIYSNAWPTNFNNVISGTGNLIISNGCWTQFFNTSDNTYVGDTKVLTWAAAMTSARTFNGNVTVQGFGELDLQSVNNVDPAATVLVSSFKTPCAIASVPATLTLKDDFVPNIDPNSSGLIAFGRNTATGPNINARLAVGAPQLGNGYMSYGGGGTGLGSATFTGASLQPDLDHVFRFMPTTGENDSFVLNNTATGVGVLTDVGGVATSVEITAFPAQQCGQVMRTLNTNDFTGSLTINPSVWFQGYANPGGSPFGSSAALGDLNINGGGISLASYQSAPGPITKGHLNLQGQAAMSLWTGDTTCVSAISVTDIVRNNRAILGITPNGGTLGANEQLLVTSTTNPVINGNNDTMAPPYFVRYDNAGFLRYDPVQGFVDATFTKTDDLVTAGATDIVNLTVGGVVPTGGASVYALRTNGPLTGGKITIASGGLILATGGDWGAPVTHTAAIDFGAAEGIIFVSGSWSGNWRVSANEFDGTISGTNGLTFGATLSGNSARRIVITSDNSNTLFGQITINEGVIAISNAGALGSPNNPILLNGGTGVNGNSLCGSLSIDGQNSFTLANPITVGPNGGTIMLDYATGNLTLTNQISGPGALTLAGHIQQNLTLTNGANDYTGGTMVRGTSLWVSATGKLGPGPVLINNGSGNGYDGVLNLEGTTNTDVTNSIAIYVGAAYDDNIALNVMSSAATIGSLEGNGRVMLNAWQLQGNTTLTLGGNNASTDFYGVIQDCDPYHIGSIVKQGTGTFTFWGDGVYRGTTTVNAGTLAVNGNLTGDTVTVNSATLTGAGRIDRTVQVNSGGAFTGSLTINGDLITTGAVNSSGAVNGNLLATGGSVTGNLAVNGNVTLGAIPFSSNGTVSGAFTSNGATVTGSAAVHGNVAIAGGSFGGAHAIVGAVAVEGGTFGGANTVTGNVTLGQTSGSGIVAGASAITGNVDVYAGLFSGGHTISGNLTAHNDWGSSTLAPSDTPGTVKILTVVGNVSLDATTTLNYQLASPGLPDGGGVNDFIDIKGSGNLILDGTLDITALGTFHTGTYRLMNYTGTLTDSGLAIGIKPDLDLTYQVVAGSGRVDLVVTSAYAPGDVNHDGAVNSLDIDDIYRHFGTGPSFAQWDVNGDGVVNQADVTYEVTSTAIGLKTEYGDANLDHKVNFTDFQVLLDHWQATGGVWATGDFTGDTVVNFGDFQKLLDYWNPAGYGASVPEPTALVLLGLGALGLIRRRK